ncbi:hypothetical protein H0H93_012240 [Arthromyces matolae]|nr:hypothetical protein H0H93_012240 [Arthromyces matolae]
MPRTARSKPNTRLYTHQPATSSKVFTSNKSGYVRSVDQTVSIDSSDETDVTMNESSTDLFPIGDEDLDTPALDSESNPIRPSELSGIKVKPPAKRYLNSVWSEEHFSRTSFFEMGIRFQVGHNGSGRCMFATPAHKDLMVIHVNGIHHVLIDYCSCSSAYEPYQQLLDAALYPGTPLEPQTCATFTVLRQFHTMNLQGKISAFDYYKALELMTDANGMIKLRDRLPSFMIMVREWRHLKAAKRAGGGHSGVKLEETPRGEFAVKCRACPVPKVNLPPGWENAPAETSWLYQLILSQDANFRLKNRLRSSNEKDPSLQPGFAYFVSDDNYLSHLAKNLGNVNGTTDDEISHCVGFAAIWLANTRKSKGLRATGVASVSCSRHQFFCPNGTGDLQKGEKCVFVPFFMNGDVDTLFRYSNMDFLFFMALLWTYFPWILLCYDIACQYARRFWDRMELLPVGMRFAGPTFVQWAVPKFHLPAHKSECHGPFALNYTPGVGRTDGEGVERNWAFLNGAAPSTSQMGPGARHDTLDDFMGFWNFRKTVDYGV